MWDKKIEKHAKNIDKLITGLIFWTTVAGWVYGISKTKKWKKLFSKILDKSQKEVKKVKKLQLWKKAWRWFWKWLIFVVSLFSKKK